MQARLARQVIERLRQSLFFKRQPLADLYRRSAMVQAGEQKLHAHTTQVIAEHRTTAMAMAAALRPRQPAVVRR